MGSQWSKSRAAEWYDSVGWLRGCNYMPANCANRIDMWQNLGLEEHTAWAAEELALAHRLGFNSVRLILEFTVWREEHDTFFDNVDRYLALCDENEINVMLTVGNDCVTPKTEHWREEHVGVQPCDWGYHGGKKYSPHQSHDLVGFHVLDAPETRDLYFDFVRESIERYRNDSRVVMWDLYNEPGNVNRGDMTLKNLPIMFEIARGIDPIQPLTVGIYNGRNTASCNEFCFKNEDVISYHCYGTIEENVRYIRELKSFERPIINSEWLARPIGSTIQDLFPFFYAQNVSCYMWGFVAGRYQTYEPYNATWERYERGELRDFDFRLWYHDLYRPSHRPYDPKETELIRRICDLADDDMKKKKT